MYEVLKNGEMVLQSTKNSVVMSAWRYLIEEGKAVRSESATFQIEGLSDTTYNSSFTWNGEQFAWLDRPSNQFIVPNLDVANEMIADGRLVVQ